MTTLAATPSLETPTVLVAAPKTESSIEKVLKWVLVAVAVGLIGFLGFAFTGVKISTGVVVTQDHINTANKMVHNASIKLAQDSEKQYYNSKAYSTQTNICAYAGITAMYWNQAGNKAKYRQWAATERRDCK